MKLDSMSEVEGVDGMEYKNNPLNVYSSYNFEVITSRKELPIDSFKNKVLQMQFLKVFLEVTTFIVYRKINITNFLSVSFYYSESRIVCRWSDLRKLRQCLPNMV